MADLNQGDSIPELKVTPDEGLTKRYAEASGDPNPIHTDPEFAKSAGLPGCILHGLWTMAQVARANSEAGGDPMSLKRLSVQFRGMGFPEQEVTVTGTVVEARRHRRRRHGRRAERQRDHQERPGGAEALAQAPRPLLDLGRAFRAAAGDPRAGRPGVRRRGEARRLQGDRRATRDRVERLDRALRALVPRDEGFLSHPTPRRAGSRPTPATASTSSELLRSAERLPAPRGGELRLSAGCAARSTRRFARRRPRFRGSPTSSRWSARRRSHTATIHRVEVLRLQPRTAMVVVIASNGGVIKRVFSFRDGARPSGLVEWAGSYLNERLVGPRPRGPDGRRPPRGPRAERDRARLPRRDLGRLRGARGVRRGDALRGRRGAAALRGALGRRPGRRGADAGARAARRHAAHAALGARRSARSSSGSAARTPSPSCARSA